MNNKKSKNKSKKEASRVKAGTLEITRSGLGFVVVENEENDILVRPNDMNHALNGDKVEVKVIKENTSTKKREGRITKVISRRQKEFVGRIQLSEHFAFFITENDNSVPDFYIPLNQLNGATQNDKVIVELIKWDEDDKKPVGKVVAKLDAASQSDLAMKSLLAENGFPLMFPDDVVEETERLPDTISAEDMAGRKDCRSLLTFTIDPADAKDFDDAISFRKLKNGNLEVGVHIADVSHFVTPGTALDDEAYKKATSVYLPDRVNPMLPEKISNELCSLRPNEDKLCFSAIFQISPKAQVKNYWLGKTVIHSDFRFAYEDAQKIIEGAEGNYRDEILALHAITAQLRKKRFSKGAINFSSQEVRFRLDEKGKPIGIVIKESKEANQLIEELMLLANKTVAEYISKIKINKKTIPFPFRVHDAPDEIKLMPFVEFAKKFGYKFDTSTPAQIAHSFNAMLDAVKGRPEQHVLEQLGIRTMAKAAYTTNNIGHYGLAFENYCHFTSPIRRYPDIMVHRILESALQESPIIDKKLEQKCVHCSERERAAMEVERAANKYKQVEYMQDYLGYDFDAVITGVAPMGFWAETIEQKCEGLVSINDLSDYDEFLYVESEFMLAGRRSGRTFRMGDKLKIKVVAASLDKRQLDYQWVPNGSEQESERTAPIAVRAKKTVDKKHEKPGSKNKARKKKS